MKKNNKTGYCGVFLRYKSGGVRCWQAGIHYSDGGPKKHVISLGIFDSPEKAARAYDFKLIELVKDGKRGSQQLKYLNFPEEHGLEIKMLHDEALASIKPKKTKVKEPKEKSITTPNISSAEEELTSIDISEAERKEMFELLPKGIFEGDKDSTMQNDNISIILMGDKEYDGDLEEMLDIADLTSNPSSSTSRSDSPASSSVTDDDLIFSPKKRGNKEMLQTSEGLHDPKDHNQSTHQKRSKKT